MHSWLIYFNVWGINLLDNINRTLLKQSCAINIGCNACGANQWIQIFLQVRYGRKLITWVCLDIVYYMFQVAIF